MTVTLEARADPPAGGTARVVGQATKEASPGEVVSFEVEAVPNGGYVFVTWTSGQGGVTFSNRLAGRTEVFCKVPEGADPGRSLSFYAVGHFGHEGGEDTPPSYDAGWIVLSTMPNNARWGATTPALVTRYGITPPQRFSQRIVATPNLGYVFKHWMLNGLVLDSTRYPADAVYTTDFPNLYERRLAFVAVFEPVEIRVTLETSTVAGDGTTEPLRETKVAKFGVPVSFTAKATPRFGSRFVKWVELSVEGVGGSRNARYTFGYEPRVTSDVMISLGAYFEPYPGPGPRPPDYPGPDPDDPEDDGKPAIEISTYVSPQEAADVGATTYPVFQRKTGDAGESASFTIEAYPQRAGDQTANPYNFDHWEDGDGNIVSTDRIYTFSKRFPSSGVDSYGYTAVYTPEAPQHGFRSLHVWAGANTYMAGQDKPDGGDSMLGYGTATGGGVEVAGDAYGRGDDGYVDVESYVVGNVRIGYDVYPEYKDVHFPAVTAKTPADGHCRFVRWEGRVQNGYGPWVEVSKDETVTHEMLVAAFPNKFWGYGGAASGKWKDWYGSVQYSQSNAIELRAVFEIARMVIIGTGNDYPTDELTCYRLSDEPGTISENGFHEKGYELFPLFPGESAFVPFVIDDGEMDPPDGYIHKDYAVEMTAPHESSSADKSFRSTRHYRGISFAAPADTSDFVIDPNSFNFANDRENGWQLTSAILHYHKLTGMPIADCDPDTGAGSGRLLHDAAGNIICDDSACPLNG